MGECWRVLAAYRRVSVCMGIGKSKHTHFRMGTSRMHGLRDSKQGFRPERVHGFVRNARDRRFLGCPTLGLFSSRSTPRILKEGALKPANASPCPIFVLVHSPSTLRHSSPTPRSPYGTLRRSLYLGGQPRKPSKPSYGGHGERSKAQSRR